MVCKSLFDLTGFQVSCFSFTCICVVNYISLTIKARAILREISNITRTVNLHTRLPMIFLNICIHVFVLKQMK